MCKCNQCIISPNNLTPKTNICVPKIYVDFLKNIYVTPHITESELIKGLISEIQSTKSTR